MDVAKEYNWNIFHNRNIPKLELLFQLPENINEDKKCFNKKRLRLPEAFLIELIGIQPNAER
jgi:hypothetical protein